MSDAIRVCVATADHTPYADEIVATIEAAARQRGTGIARRDPEYIRSKMLQGKAVIALMHAEGTRPLLAGFCYIETWSDARYVANSGLIVVPELRHSGLARRIKRAAFELSQTLYPTAKMFGITTSHAVMKINTQLGYVPVPFSELTDDEQFWNGCRSCPNHDILERTNHRMCLCTGMLFDPADPRAIERQKLHLVEEAAASGADATAGAALAPVVEDAHV